MRLCPANKLVLTACLVLAVATPAQAQQLSPQATSAQQAQAAQVLSQALANLPAKSGAPARTAGTQSASPQYNKPVTTTLTQTQLDALLADPESPQAKAAALAAKRKYQSNLEKNLIIDSGEDYREPPPLGLSDMQEIGVAPPKGEENRTSYLGGSKENGTNVLSLNSDQDEGANPLSDLRREAQMEAALSFGARGGLAARNFEIMVRLEAFEETMDKVFNFRSLLVKAPSGLLIEPPIVRESSDSLIVTENGTEAAVADRIYDISKQAKIVTAPRDWRHYLIQEWVSRVPNPPRLLWPENAAERANWRRWVAEGWRAGTRQADDMFQANLARLVTDFNGMIRYRTLLSQGMVSQPYAMHEDRGVTGTKTVMRIGDRALRLTGPSQFLMGADLWKPADR